MDLELREAKAEGGCRVTCTLIALKAFQGGWVQGGGKRPRVRRQRGRKGAGRRRQERGERGGG